VVRSVLRGCLDVVTGLLLMLLILMKNIYTLWGRKRFLLPVTNLSTNLVYPFTLRVTGIIIKKKKL